MHKLVQIVRFESARKLPKVPEGHPCGNVYGLAFKLEVHVEGEVDPETGFVIDFGHIESAIKPTYDLIDHNMSLIHIRRCRRPELCRSRWSPYH